MFVVIKKRGAIFVAASLLLSLALVAGGLFFPGHAAMPGENILSPGKDSKPPTVYLTFDDGPSRNTGKVLDILKEEGVHGTFFVIGVTEDDKIHLYHRIVDEGNAIGLHSYSHKTNVIYRSFDAFLTDFQNLEEWIEENLGQSPKICRLPGGTNNLIYSKTLKKQILDYFSEEGYVCFDWNIDPLDSGSCALPPQQLADRVIQCAEKQPGEDLVILMHDDSLRKTLPDALKIIIPYFKEEGYQFAVLREDTKLPCCKS